jgi:hypothetical protein
MTRWVGESETCPSIGLLLFGGLGSAIRRSIVNLLGSAHSADGQVRFVPHKRMHGAGPLNLVFQLCMTSAIALEPPVSVEPSASSSNSHNQDRQRDYNFLVQGHDCTSVS